MRLRKTNYFFLIFWLLIIFSSDHALGDSSTFLTDTPETIDYHHWEVYLFTSLDKNNIASEEPDLNAPAMEFNYGVLPNLQLHLIIPYAWSLPSAAPAHHGLGDIETGVKYRFIQETKHIPQVGIFPLFEIPTGNVDMKLGNGKIWMKLPLWLQKSWDSWITSGGFGYVINPAKNMRSYPYAGWFLQKDINKKFSLSTEIFTQGAVSTNSRSFTVLDVGATYNFTKTFSLLFTAGHTILGEQHIIGYLSLYWTGP